MINLSGCELLTDKCMKYLNKCRSLDISGCKLITPLGLSCLTKCHTLNIWDCPLIYNNEKEMIQTFKYLYYDCSLRLNNFKFDENRVTKVKLFNAINSRKFSI